ncbi:MAG: nucleoside monophosphate kinase [Algisphaera sp.]
MSNSSPAVRTPGQPPAERYKCVLLLGAPGAGKGTQGSILGRIPGYFHCACGDVFRNIDITSSLGRTFYEYSSRGELVPDRVTVQMWAAVIEARTVIGDYKPHADILVLDGIPRTLEQAKLMDRYIDVQRVIHLTCDDETAMFERLRRRALKSNRHDDADEKVIRHRWEVYAHETAPVLEHYPADQRIDINSIGSPAQILHDILEGLIPVQNEHFRASEV